MITTLFYSNEIHASPDTPAHVRIDIVNSGSTVARPQLDVIGLPEGWMARLSSSEPREIFYVHIASGTSAWERPGNAPVSAALARG